MSKENVEIARRGWEAFERGDIETAFATFDEGVVATAPGPGTYHGISGVLEMFRDWTEGFEDFSMTAVEFTDANDSQLVVRVHQHARGSKSGVEIEDDYWFVYTLRDGKAVRFEVFATQAEAFEAAGLR